MKKLICLVLIFSFMLTACSKWKVEIVDPREPIEIEQETSSESKKEEIEQEEPEPEEIEEPEKQDFDELYEPKNCGKEEAESYFYSAEGYEDMVFLVGWLGATEKDFENDEEFLGYAYLRFFMPELYEILGAEYMTEDGNFLQVPKGLADKYFIKYFGVYYEPDETDPSYNPKENCYDIAGAGGGMPCKLLSYGYPQNIDRNRFSVDVLVLEWQDELGKHFAYSKMVFDVMEDEEGKFLRLVSNEVNEHFHKASFEMQAQSLTNQIVQLIGKKSLEEGYFRTGLNDYEVGNGAAKQFIIREAIFTNAGMGFDKNSPYVGSFGKAAEYQYLFPVEEAERVAFEVFGIEDFSCDFGSNFELDSEKNAYVSGLEWGMEHGAEAKDMTTTVDGNIYSVEFTLRYVGTNSEGDPEWMDGERYIMNFELIEGEFLRYVGFEKA